MTTRDVEGAASAVARVTWQPIQQQQAVQSRVIVVVMRHLNIVYERQHFYSDKNIFLRV